ncbi:unnamed protein product, partial [Polarella glacialis]
MLLRSGKCLPSMSMSGGSPASAGHHKRRKMEMEPRRRADDQDNEVQDEDDATSSPLPRSPLDATNSPSPGRPPVTGSMVQFEADDNNNHNNTTNNNNRGNNNNHNNSSKSESVAGVVDGDDEEAAEAEEIKHTQLSPKQLEVADRRNLTCLPVALPVATNSELYLELVELSGHVVAKGAWSATLQADCLYKSAHLAKPGRRCRLLQGTLEITPFTALAALDLSVGTCIQVVWLPSSAVDKLSQSQAFAAIKADGS